MSKVNKEDQMLIGMQQRKIKHALRRKSTEIDPELMMMSQLAHKDI